MSPKFSDIIKTLRKQRGLTQEQMAEAMNISCQAISKWETNASYPDISFLPILADYFGCSIDYLLGHDTSHIQEEINAICLKAQALFETHEYLSAAALLREALIKHPGNEKIMYNLAWALSGTLNEHPDYYDEAILLYHKILEISTDTNMRTIVVRDLVYRYGTKGETEKALAYANQLPTFDVCREYTIGRSNLLEGKELAECLKRNITLFGNAMTECLEYFLCENILTDEEKAPVTSEAAGTKLELLKQILDKTTY